MLPLFRPKNEKDLCQSLYGKPRKFRLTRNGSAVALVGQLLSVFRHEAPHDGLMPPAAGRVDLLAVIRTQAGRYFVYYIVIYPETEDIAGRHEYAHICEDLDAVQAFLQAMHYPNRPEFEGAVLAQARATLAWLNAKGKKPAKVPLVQDAGKPDAGLAAKAAPETAAPETGQADADQEPDSPSAAPTAETPPAAAPVSPPIGS